MRFINVVEEKLNYITGAHQGEGSRGSGNLPFFDTVKIVPSSFETNLEETKKKISLKNENIYQKDLPTAFS